MLLPMIIVDLLGIVGLHLNALVIGPAHDLHVIIPIVINSRRSSMPVIICCLTLIIPAVQVQRLRRIQSETLLESAPKGKIPFSLIGL